MKIDDADAEHLRKWAMKKLEDISDADSDVLADYVLALFKSQDDDENVRKTCLEQLEDFLKEHTVRFVDEVFFAVRNKSYLPGYKPPQQPLPSPGTAAFNPPTGPATTNAAPQVHGNLNGGRGDPSRKRSYLDRDAPNGQDPHYGRGTGGDRGTKQMRRGGRTSHHTGSRGDRPAEINLLGQHLQVPNIPPMPTPPAGFPPLDPNNPLAAILAMQALGLPTLPPNMTQSPHAGSPTYFQQHSPPFPQQGSQDSPMKKGMASRKGRKRCSDYDTKGFCAMGSSCPFEHGQDRVVLQGQEQEEYDPTNASMDLDDSRAVNDQKISDFNRGPHQWSRGRHSRGRGDRGHPNSGRGGKRADFSHLGPSHDKSNPTIVVEQIPEENFSEDAVRNFFSEFGPIEEITMQAYKHLAIVRFGDYESAKRAWDSPKVIFGNRFVKVYWYRADSLSKTRANGTTNGKHKGDDDAMEGVEEAPIDPVEFAKKQEEAQKVYEDKQKALKDTELKREELDAKLKAQAEERKKLYEKLAAKTGTISKAASPGIGADGGSNVGPVSTSNGSATDTKTTTQTDALRAKLAELEAEAESMGISPDDAWQQGYPPRGRGYSPYRGRGRGRGFDPSRGGYAPFRGREGLGSRGGGVKRLDNRPRRVAVAVPGQEWDAGKDEALRQFLLFSGTDYESLEAHPDRKDAHIVGFKERWLAEKFFNGTNSIPHIGTVELSWVSNPLPVAPSASTSALPSAKHIGGATDTDSTMSDGAASNLRVGVEGVSGTGVGSGGGGGMDYDVAEDDDRWMD